MNTETLILMLKIWFYEKQGALTATPMRAK